MVIDDVYHGMTHSIFTITMNVPYWCSSIHSPKTQVIYMLLRCWDIGNFNISLWMQYEYHGINPQCVFVWQFPNSAQLTPTPKKLQYDKLAIRMLSQWCRSIHMHSVLNSLKQVDHRCLCCSSLHQSSSRNAHEISWCQTHSYAWSGQVVTSRWGHHLYGNPHHTKGCSTPGICKILGIDSSTNNYTVRRDKTTNNNGTE